KPTSDKNRMETDKKIETKHINYIIVVHGIGDQRTNETVMPVINRFAEVRQDAHEPQKREVVTLGMVTSQTGRPEMIGGEMTFSHTFPWSEFENIPQEPYAKLPPFLGGSSFTGENIRFVDMHWADIMENDFKHVGQKVGEWAKSIIGRLEVKARPDKDGKSRVTTSEAWVMPILYQLEETLIFLDNLLSAKFPFVEDLIFNKFLGDVQVYGEYQQIRGKAVRRFHNLMEKIEREHIKQFSSESIDEEGDRRYFSNYENAYVKPRYTILAHSLGTVMAMDALLYAHTSKEVYEFPGKFSNLPFTGYANKYEKINEHSPKEDSHYWLLRNCKNYLGEKWLDNVASFVTLGSPIDKFLTIWWQNYVYLGKDKGNLSKRGDTVDQIFMQRRDGSKIKHYNYCDEQDPVGHQLDKFKSKKIYERIFDIKEDMVFNRYGTPGVAHVKYWEDIDLFKRIIRLVVDKEPEVQLENSGDFDDFEYKKGTYGKVLFFSYGMLQMLGVSITTFFMMWGFSTRNWETSVIGSLGLVASLYLLRKFIKISIWWRQVLKSKNTSVKTKNYALEWQAKVFRIFMKAMTFVLVVLDWVYIPTRFQLVNISDADQVHYLNYFRDLVIIGFAGWILHYLLYTKKRSGGKISLWKLAEIRTFVWSSLIVGVGIYISIYHGADIQLFMLSIIPFENLYNNFFTIILISTTLIWLYTVACHRIARETVILRERPKGK
ncbi:MAG: hypothetical protein ACI81T_000283, partial [Bacteroidia bacterium]